MVQLWFLLGLREEDQFVFGKLHLKAKVILITSAAGGEQSTFLKCVNHPWQGHIGAILLH